MRLATKDCQIADGFLVQTIKSSMQMEALKRKVRSRRPLSDLTNGDTAQISSHSSSSSPTTTASALKTFKAQLSFSGSKHRKKSCKAGETAGFVINRTASVNLRSAPPFLDSNPSRPTPPNNTWISGSRYGGAGEPISVYTRRKTSDRSKNKGKAVAEPVAHITATRDRSGDIEDIIWTETLESLPNKKQRFMPHEHKASKNVLPLDYIEKQRAYFDEIDLEPLSVEEIASDAELD